MEQRRRHDRLISGDNHIDLTCWFALVSPMGRAERAARGGATAPGGGRRTRS